ncbi:MAG: hypothetical protein ACRDQW_08860, partial [Haloechinothrix sp.]
DLVVTWPDGGIELVAGGDPVDLPITVRNDGETKSDPVVVTLSLPDGVSAISPAGGGGQTGSARSGRPRLTAPVAAQAQPVETVRCPAGTGKVSCSTTDGLEPGESAKLIFRLVANETAQGGAITGTVSSGSLAPVKVRVPVELAYPEDAVDLEVRGTVGHGSHIGRILHLTVTNTGESTKPVTVRIDRRAIGHQNRHTADVTCSEESDSTTCTSDEPSEPDDKLKFMLLLTGQPDPGVATVVATLGEAQVTEEVMVDCLGNNCGIEPRSEEAPESDDGENPADESGGEQPPRGGANEDGKAEEPGSCGNGKGNNGNGQGGNGQGAEAGKKSDQANKHRASPALRFVSAMFRMS